MREVLGVAVMVQREPVVGDDDPTAPVEHASHHEPLARYELVGPVHVRVAEVRRVGMQREHDLFGTRDAVALLVLVGFLHRGCILGDRYRQAIRFVEPRVHEPAVRGHAPDRHELPHPTAEHVGHRAQPPVHRKHGVERPTVERGAERVLVVGVRMHVLDRGRRLGPFVETPVQDRDEMATFDEAVDQRDPGGPGPADDQDTLLRRGHAGFRTTRAQGADRRSNSYEPFTAARGQFGAPLPTLE